MEQEERAAWMSLGDTLRASVGERLIAGVLSAGAAAERLRPSGRQVRRVKVPGTFKTEDVEKSSGNRTSAFLR